MERLVPSVLAGHAQTRAIRVLLVDDSPATLAALSRLVARLFPVEIAGQAENGQKALALAEQLKPHLCIVDLQMPVMDGLQLVEVLRQRYPTMKSIITSVQDAPGLQQASLKRGADAFILKERLAEELPVVLARLFVDGANEILPERRNYA